MQFRASMYVGPTQVQFWANRARLHFAGCPVFEGTERVWIRDIQADSIYDVEASMRLLFPIRQGFRTGMCVERTD